MILFTPNWERLDEGVQLPTKRVKENTGFSGFLYSLATTLGSANQLLAGCCGAGSAQDHVAMSRADSQVASYGKWLGGIGHYESPELECAGVLCHDCVQLSGYLVGLCPIFLLCCPKII